MEDDGDFDRNSTIGKLIQEVNKLCKKPQIDEELSKALDKFQEKVSRQKSFLKNGIFNINFAEAALFIQSSAELYGKKIDLFWDQLLEFHTRLIEYDCRDEQEKGKKLNTDAIQQLEERRNRFKRKKKFKLAMEESDKNLYNYLFDKSTAEEKPGAFEPNEDLYKAWKRLEWESLKISKIPKAVVAQQRKTYRMKNYYIMKDMDCEIYDLEDGEFNTMYSRIPGWHIIKQLFEYNTLGLLPDDKNNTIARLRLCSYLRAQFMTKRNIPFNAPYSQYKEEYLAYKKQFFEEEAKKWQNMPLNTMADLRRQLDYLAQKEREEEGIIPKKSWDMPSFLHKKGCSYEGCSECSEDSKSTITISDSLDKEVDDSFLKEEINKSEKSDVVDSSSDLHDSGFESSGTLNSSILENSITEGTETEITLDKNVVEAQESNVVEAQESLKKTLESQKTIEAVASSNKNDTNENLDKNQENLNKTAEIDKTNDITEVSEESDITKNADSTQKQLNKTVESENQTVTNTVIDSDNLIETSESNEILQVVSNTTEDTQPRDIATDISVNKVTATNTTQSSDKVLETSRMNDADQDQENDNPDDSFDTRNIMSDHDYCLAPVKINVLKENNVNKQKSKYVQDNMVPMDVKSRIIQKFVTLKMPKDIKIKDDTLMGPPPPKIRKLSRKQMEKLLKSKITPVRELKFENFFSMNYQPQLGEGEIQFIDYDPDIEEVTPEEILAPDEDVRSIISDHSYCHLPDDLPIDDSGFIDAPSPTAPSPTMSPPIAPTPTTLDTTESQEDNHDGSDPVEEFSSESRVPEKKKDLSAEEQVEYERLLAQLRETRRQRGDELRIDPERVVTERQKKEKERLEARARVEQWRETITPILKNLNEKDFDIHEYGSKVMEGMEVEEMKPFKNIIDGKTASEVVRYFIASLQLANTYNIEICGAMKGEISNDSFNVKLLKKDRYHEQLTQYHAPSEDDFRKNLKRMKQVTSDGDDEEEQESEPVPKRKRIDVSNKRKRQSRTSVSSISSTNMSSPLGSPVKRSKNQTVTPSNPVKGKNIVKSFSVVLNNADINNPSTSRSSFEISSPNSQSFYEDLSNRQLTNPEHFSTPSPSPSRSQLPVKSKAQLVFE